MHGKALIDLDRVPQSIGTTGYEYTNNFTKALYILKENIGTVLLTNQNPDSENKFTTELKNVLNCILNTNKCNESDILIQFKTQIDEIRLMMNKDNCVECNFYLKTIFDTLPYTFTNNKIQKTQLVQPVQPVQPVQQ